MFTATLLAAGAFLARDALRRTPPPHALMNVEGIAALSLLGLLFARCGKRDVARMPPGLDVLWLVAIPVLVALAFLPILHTPLLYDDYTHISDASRASWGSIAWQFGRVPGQDLFFRPVGFALYRLNYLWARSDAAFWHGSNAALHVICCLLVYMLCREQQISRAASCWGALIFGVSGIAAETVAWIDAGFAALTAAFVLSSLICVCRYARSGRVLWLGMALVAGACAMLSKETAYCLAFLVASLGLICEREYRNRIARSAFVFAILTVVLFTYRWWALGGIGGYAGSNGNVDILHFNPVHTLDALFLRQWAVLLFPFNWSLAGAPLRALVVANLFVFGACAWLAKPPRRALLGCVAFIFAAALPVEHLLLIGPSLAGARTLYLGLIGWALLWAFVLDRMLPPVRFVFVLVLLALQAVMLEHNLVIWRGTSELAQSVCVHFGHEIAGTAGAVSVGGLPATRYGTVFLRNGFPQCVQMNSGVPAWRIQAPGANTSSFAWDATNGRIEPERR